VEEAPSACSESVGDDQNRVSSAPQLAEREDKHREALERISQEASEATARERAARQRTQRRLRAVVSAIVLFIVALALLLAVGLSTGWAILGGVSLVVGFAAALDQLWIRRAGD